MRLLKNSYLVFYLILVFTACTREVDIAVPDYKKKPVINGLFNSDSLFDLSIRESNTFDYLENAEIKLFRDDSFLMKFDYTGQGKYRCSYHPKSKQNYSIEARFDDYEVVYANDYMPQKIPIIQLEYEDSAGINSNQIVYSQVKVRFKDPGEEINYYECFVYEKYDTAFIEIDTNRLFSSADTTLDINLDSLKNELHQYYGKLRINSSDPAIAREVSYSDPGYFKIDQKELFFSDRYFNGKQLTFRINLLPSYYQFCQIKKRYFVVYLRSISKNYYLYEKQKFAHNQYEAAQLWKNPADFVRLHSNVENGYGLFAGYSQSVDTIKVINNVDY